jgi:hypothetical protein
LLLLLSFISFLLQQNWLHVPTVLYSLFFFSLVVPLGRPVFLVNDDETTDALSNKILEAFESDDSVCSIKSETTDLAGFTAMVFGGST